MATNAPTRHFLQIYKDYFPVLGGIENHVRDLSEALVGRGHRVTVLTTSLDHRTTVETPRPGFVVIKAARLFHAASTPISIAAPLLARHLRADIAHVHMPYPPGDLLARLVRGRPPLVITYHSDIVRQQGLLRLYRPLLERTLSQAAVIMATSPQYVQSSPFLRRHVAKCAVVPLGVDVARFGNATPEQIATLRQRYGIGKEPHALFVGRLRYYKGLHILLDALATVPEARLLVAGTGPERERLVGQANALGIVGRVQFLGDVPDHDLPVLYQSAALFALPAHLRAEALGVAQIEALASGVPCISTELGTGTSFANLHGVTGLVVPPDDPAALAKALQTLLGDQALRTTMGAAGRERAATLFSRDAMVNGVEQVYQQVLKQRAG